MNDLPDRFPRGWFVLGHQRDFPVGETKTIFGFNNKILISRSEDSLIKVDVDMPDEVGVDRLINSYAGLNLYNGPLIIIDFGTATTFDLVNSSGSYIGGIICPGVNLSIQSLAHNTAKLPLIEIKKVEKLIGKDTTSAIESGIYWGYVSLVGGLIDRLKKQNGFKDANIVATGGLSGMFRDDLSQIKNYEPDLTLKGLNIIYNEYKK